MSLQKHAIFGDPTEILPAISGKHHLPELLPLAVQDGLRTRSSVSIESSKSAAHYLRVVA